MPPDRQKRKKQWRRWCYRRGLPIFFCSACCFITLLQWVLTIFPVPPKPTKLSCQNDPQGYVLHDRWVCTDTCGKLCFPRIHGLCFSQSHVTVCDAPHPLLPSIMRFSHKIPRQKVPVIYGPCPHLNSSIDQAFERANWISGLHMVADLTLMPSGRAGPNPHHESEKILPAILLSHLYGLQNSTLYWFANPHDHGMISKWSLGLLEVFSNNMTVEFLQLPSQNQPPICFEDAIVFAGRTNAAYIPSVDAHNWLRNTILQHCNIPVVKANRPVQDVLVIHRANSSRNIANYAVCTEILERQLRVPAKLSVPGPWEFCEQVRLVAEADVVLTPHGSQNVNLIAARPGAVVIEVFPFLYYIDWYDHYLHAGSIKHLELYGTYEDGKVPVLMRIFSMIYGWKNCFQVRHCMNYAKRQKIHVDLDELELLLQSYIANCGLVVKDSKCSQQISDVR